MHICEYMTSEYKHVVMKKRIPLFYAQFLFFSSSLPKFTKCNKMCVNCAGVVYYYATMNPPCTARVNQQPTPIMVHHPLDAPYESVVDEPQLD